MGYRIIARVKLPERRGCYEYLQKHLPHAEFVIDNNNSARTTLHRALKLAGDDPCIHVEEDIWLTSNFLLKINEVISDIPDRVINFFSMRKKDLTIGGRYEPPSSFMMTQCVYLPSGYSKMLLDYFPDWKGQYTNISGTDLFISDWLKTRKERYYLHVPSLVDHRQIRSVIDRRRSRNRISLTFKEGVYE